MTAFFSVLMLVVVIKLITFAFRAAWGIAKILLTIVFVPIALIAIAVSGFVSIAVLGAIALGVVAFAGNLLT